MKTEEMDEVVPGRSWLRRLFSSDRRRAKRQQARELRAYYWDGSPPVPHDIRDISSSGLYLLASEGWRPGTVVMMTLQKTDCPEDDPDRAMTVQAQVIRSASDGIGLRFILPRPEDYKRLQGFLRTAPDKKPRKTPLRSIGPSNGQALVEYALMLPLIFLLIVNMVNFGGFFFAWITVANAARAGADYAILGGASAGDLIPATGGQVAALVQQDASSLPNVSSLTVGVCQNYNGTVTTLTGSCTTTPDDPEPTNYVLTTVQVSYTYKPFIPVFQFPSLDIYATLPPLTVTRTAYMRSIQ